MGYPPFSNPGITGATLPIRADSMPSIQHFLDELPSIDDFVDLSSAALPSIGDFLAADNDAADEPWRPQDDDVQPAEFDSEGWAIAGWQSFDWSGAAALGVRPEERGTVADSWDTHEWSAAPVSAAQGSARRGMQDVPPSADEVARALDGIARRIRSGDLLIDQLSGTPPEAAMATAIAALLRMRD